VGILGKFVVDTFAGDKNRLGRAIGLVMAQAGASAIDSVVQFERDDDGTRYRHNDQVQEDQEGVEAH
jgi:hypothetical protein